MLLLVARTFLSSLLYASLLFHERRNGFSNACYKLLDRLILTLVIVSISSVFEVISQIFHSYQPHILQNINPREVYVFLGTFIRNDGLEFVLFSIEARHAQLSLDRLTESCSVASFEIFEILDEKVYHRRETHGDGLPGPQRTA